MKTVTRTMGLFIVAVMSIVSLGFAKSSQDMKDVSYALGVDMGKSFKSEQIQLQPDAFYKGLQDGFIAKNKPRFSEKQVGKILLQFQQDLQAKRLASLKAAGEENAKQGKLFLAKNKQKKGIVTLADGLQYQIIKSGKGPKPQLDDVVTVHYKGTLVDGKQFESSYERGKPITIPLRQVIKGWQEALQLMAQGSKWRIFIPPQLAYGEFGTGGLIGPNQTLIFDLELQKIEKHVAKKKIAKK